MKRLSWKVRNVRWRRSNLTGLMFEVGDVHRTVNKQKTIITVFRAAGTWLSANPEHFKP